MMKIPIHVKVDPYELISETVRAGVTRGYFRAHKYSATTPTEEELIEAIREAVMGDLCELIDFPYEQDS